jgi:hypothetical protein
MENVNQTTTKEILFDMSKTEEVVFDLSKLIESVTQKAKSHGKESQLDYFLTYVDMAMDGDESLLTEFLAAGIISVAESNLNDLYNDSEYTDFAINTLTTIIEGHKKTLPTA